MKAPAEPYSQVTLLSTSQEFGPLSHVRIIRENNRELLKRFPSRNRTMARAFWFEALMRVKWESGHYADGRDEVFLERGQFVMGWELMAEDLGISVQNLRTLISSHFERLEILTHKSTSRGSIVTILELDRWIDDKKETNNETNNELTRSQQGTNNIQDSKGSKDSKKNLNLKTHVAEADASGDETMSLFVNDPESSENGKVKSDLPDDPLTIVFLRYRELIASKSKLTKESRKKIETRLKDSGIEACLEAMQKFSLDPWWMENNSHRGIAWFFKSEDRIEQFRNLLDRTEARRQRPLDREDLDGYEKALLNTGEYTLESIAELRKSKGEKWYESI